MGKSTGRLRDVTLRDARTMQLFPSVTSVLQVLAAPGLVVWKVDQAVRATLRLLTTQYAAFAQEMGLILATEDALSPSFKRDVAVEAGKIAAEARDEGQAIHDAIQHFIDGEYDRVPDQYLPHCEGVKAKLEEHFGPLEDAAWITEESFACREGFGGRSDLGSRALSALGDFKGKDFDETNLPECYEEHAMQVGAYRHGLDYPEDARLFNLFFSRTKPGLCHIVFHTPEEAERGWEMFKAALRLWQLKNNYVPVW